jgi:hypothetical protein
MLAGIQEAETEWSQALWEEPSRGKDERRWTLRHSGGAYLALTKSSQGEQPSNAWAMLDPFVADGKLHSGLF